MTHDYYRPPATLQLRGALDAHGELQAFEFHSVSPSITARFAPDTTDPFDSVVEGVQNYPYGVPNVAINYTRQEVGLDVGYLRSVSHAINCFGVESFMDELAAAAGKGPFEFRHGLLKDKPRHRRVLEAAATKAGWGRAPDGPLPGHRAHGGLHDRDRAGRGNLHRRRRAQGSQNRLRRRLRSNRQSEDRRIANRKRNRIRTFRGALGRGHDFSGQSAANEFQQLSGVALR
jgi:CO/xanthine dehydrogenase Mo-binding subunit